MEDSPNKTALVSEFLAHSGLTYTHLHVPTPRDRKLQEGDPSWLKPRGAEQRNEGLRWLRESTGGRQREQGVVYFADDDNTYSIQLFEEVRESYSISLCPFLSVFFTLVCTFSSSLSFPLIILLLFSPYIYGLNSFLLPPFALSHCSSAVV